MTNSERMLVIHFNYIFRSIWDFKFYKGIF